VFGTVRALHATGMSAVAALVFVTTILIPAADLAALLYLLGPRSGSGGSRPACRRCYA